MQVEVFDAGLYSGLKLYLLGTEEFIETVLMTHNLPTHQKQFIRGVSVDHAIICRVQNILGGNTRFINF
jgi:acyl-CoA thioesterase